MFLTVTNRSEVFVNVGLEIHFFGLSLLVDYQNFVKSGTVCQLDRSQIVQLLQQLASSVCSSTDQPLSEFLQNIEYRIRVSKSTPNTKIL